MTIRRTLTLLSLLASAVHPRAAARADEAPSFTLTTDTPVYCTQLARQVAEHHSMVTDVQRLLADGREMCEHGEVRGGIRRLRRALVMLHHRPLREDPPS